MTLLKLVSGASNTLTLPVLTGKRAKVQSLIATVTGADAGGDTIRIRYVQSGFNVAIMPKSSIGATAFLLSAAIGASDQGNDIEAITDPVTGILSYYNPDTRSLALPDIWLTADTVIDLIGETSAAGAQIELVYALDNLPGN